MRTYSALVLSLAIGSAAHAAGRPTTVNAEGHAVFAGSREQTLAQAKLSSLKDAVGHVVQKLGGPAEGEDDEIDQAVYDKASTFVLRTTLLYEDVDGTILNVRCSVEVDADAVARALGGRHGRKAARARNDGKRVIVLATEQLGPQRLFGWADLVWTPGMLRTHTQVIREVREMGGIEAALSDGFSSAGYAVIDPHVLRGRLAPKPAFEALDLTNGLAQQVAQRSDADFVVIAKGVAQLAYHATIAEGGMKSGQGNVVARLVRVSDGRVLASTTAHAAAVHIDADTARINALDEAARLAAGELTKKLENNQ
jgi:hypothetical protein